MLNAQAPARTEEEPLLSMAEPGETLRDPFSSVNTCRRAKGCLGKESLQHAVKDTSASGCNHLCTSTDVWKMKALQGELKKKWWLTAGLGFIL